MSPAFGVFVHPERPKVAPEKVIRLIESAGLSYSRTRPDIAVVVGGDGTFAYYGRLLSIPLLFVGVADQSIVGSKARLAAVHYDNLLHALEQITAGNYEIANKKMISVTVAGASHDVLTDAYVERGRFAGCLRYRLTVRPPRASRKRPFTEYAIANGLVVTTSFGSGGYFSYPDRLGMAGAPDGGSFGDDSIGVCHILPTTIVRKNGIAGRGEVRYRLPYGTVVRIRLLRNADARLYGTTSDSGGRRVTATETVTFGPSARAAKIISLRAT